MAAKPKQLATSDQEQVEQQRVLGIVYRRRFLNAVRRYAREVLESLRNDVLPNYESASRISKRDSVILNWANRYGLKDDWLLDIAIRTLREWKRDWLMRRALIWADPLKPWRALSSEIPRFRINYPSWNPAVETWQEFQDSLREDFEEELGRYRNRLQALFRKIGLNQPPLKRNPEHFEWLVRYQVQGWDTERIAQEYQDEQRGLDRSTVTKAINGLAELVELSLRAGRGRPSKPHGR